MTIPSFTISTGAKFTFIDGDCEQITSGVSTDLDFDAMPGMTPDQAMLFDFNGVKKVITIKGRLSTNGSNVLNSGSAITIDEQRQWLEKNINGVQSGTLFKSNYTSTWNGSSFADSVVLFGSVTWDETTGDPNSLPFTIQIFVGNV